MTAIDPKDFLPWFAASMTGSYMMNESFLEATFALNGGFGVVLGLEIGNRLGGELGAAIGSVVIPGAVEGKIDETILSMAGAAFVVFLANQYMKKNKP